MEMPHTKCLLRPIFLSGAIKDQCLIIEEYCMVDTNCNSNPDLFQSGKCCSMCVLDDTYKVRVAEVGFWVEKGARCVLMHHHDKPDHIPIREKAIVSILDLKLNHFFRHWEQPIKNSKQNNCPATTIPGNATPHQHHCQLSIEHTREYTQHTYCVKVEVDTCNIKLE
jgi:hypothetical protein